MRPPALFVARHAPVAVEGICYGQSDVATRLDAATACDVVMAQLPKKPPRIARVWTSPWSRTERLAACIAARMGVPMTTDARLSELSFGAWEGRPYVELERDPDFLAWMGAWREAAPPGGERLCELLARVRAWRSDVVASGEVGLAITHAGVVRALRAETRHLPYDAVIAEPVAALKIELLDGATRAP